jgi:hypothetical protein
MNSYCGHSKQPRRRIFGTDLTNTLSAREEQGCRGRPEEEPEWLSDLPEVLPYKEELLRCAQSKEQSSYIRHNYMSWHSDIS